MNKLILLLSLVVSFSVSANETEYNESMEIFTALYSYDSELHEETCPSV